MNIKNKSVLITGGSSGIGFAIAKLLKSQGSQVIITGRDAERLEKAGKELGVDVYVCCLIVGELLSVILFQFYIQVVVKSGSGEHCTFAP